MRKLFAELLKEQMVVNPDIYLITGDLGFGLFDDIRDSFPDRFYNTGSAEQLAVGLSVGLALNGKLPVVYSITPFLLYRPFEFIRNYVNHESIPVKLVGSGRDQDYAHDGFSHWASDDREILAAAFKNVRGYWPNSKQELSDMFFGFMYDNKPNYLNLSRSL